MGERKTGVWREMRDGTEGERKACNSIEREREREGKRERIFPSLYHSIPVNQLASDLPRWSPLKKDTARRTGRARRNAAEGTTASHRVRKSDLSGETGRKKKSSGEGGPRRTNILRHRIRFSTRGKSPPSTRVPTPEHASAARHRKHPFSGRRFRCSAGIFHPSGDSRTNRYDRHYSLLDHVSLRPLEGTTRLNTPAGRGAPHASSHVLSNFLSTWRAPIPMRQ